MSRLFVLYLFFGSCFLPSCSVLNRSATGDIPADGKPKTDIRIQVNMADVDNLGHLYVVDQRNRLVHFNTDKKELAVFANSRMGQISAIDASSAFQILAFYDDSNRAILLDNMLAPITEISFEEISPDIASCGLSNDGNLWIFDPVRLRLIKTDKNGRSLIETSNLADVGMAGCQIKWIREKGNVVVLCDPSRGFYFFDNFGQFTSHYSAADIVSFTFDGRFVTYFTSTGLKRYSLSFKERMLLGYPLDLSHPDLKSLFFTQNTFYAIYSDGIVLRKAEPLK